MVTIEIQKSPLLALLRSTYAVSNRETAGYLYGKQYDSYYLVESLLPYQRAIVQTPTKIQATSREENRLMWTAPDLEDIVGWYHSHPSYRANGFFHGKPNLSENDLDFFDELVHMALLITFNEAKRHRPLIIRPNRIIGTFKSNEGNNYRVWLTGYYKKSGEIYVANLKVSRRVLKNIFER